MKKHYKSRISPIITAVLIAAVTLVSCVSQKNVKTYSGKGKKRNHFTVC